MSDHDAHHTVDVRTAVAEGLAEAIQRATAGVPVGCIIIKKLVVNVNMANGGGATVNVSNYAWRQDVRP